MTKAIDEMTRRRADTDAENKELRQEIKNLLSQISVNNKVRFGSTSQKGTKKKSTLDYERSSSAGLLPTGRKNMLPMVIDIKIIKV